MFRPFRWGAYKPLIDMETKPIALQILIVGLGFVCLVGLFLLRNWSRGLYPFSRPEAPRVVANLKVIGDQDCIEATNRALTLLKDQSSLQVAFVYRYVGVIQCVEAGSGIHAEEKPPRYEVGKATWQAGDVWYAGTIVHDACHSQQYNDYLAAHPGEEVPRAVHFGKAAEEKCLAVQISALQDLHAPTSTIEYLKNVINTNYWEAKERSW